MSQNSTSMSATTSIFQIFSMCYNTSDLRIMAFQHEYITEKGTGKDSCHHLLCNPNRTTYLLFTVKMFNERAQFTQMKQARISKRLISVL